MLGIGVEHETVAGLRYRPLHPNIGVEVLDLDISRPLSSEAQNDLRKLWELHSLVLIRHQSLSEAEQVSFSKQFGDVVVPPEDETGSREHPEIMRVSNVGPDGKVLPVEHHVQRVANATEKWHSDGSYKAVPSYVSILHALEIPDVGGETSYAGLVAAYEALPEDMKRRIEGKHTVHYYAFTRFLPDGKPMNPLTPEEMQRLPPASHPLVRTHADGRKSLYLSANSGYYVCGMPLGEGIELFKELIEWSTRPDFVYCHRWEVGDVLIWDNRTANHSLQPYDRRKRRVLQRTELAGQEIPV
jgi:alpha-ketoglutarate-dependent taurine dioxygenase